jgi:hypothetical protein
MVEKPRLKAVIRRCAAFENAHPPPAACAFESACALPSGVI